jgi:hypothetical protein
VNHPRDEHYYSEDGLFPHHQFLIASVRNQASHFNSSLLILL